MFICVFRFKVSINKLNSKQKIEIEIRNWIQFENLHKMEYSKWENGGKKLFFNWNFLECWHFLFIVYFNHFFSRCCFQVISLFIFISLNLKILRWRVGIELELSLSNNLTLKSHFLLYINIKSYSLPLLVLLLYYNKHQ